MSKGSRWLSQQVSMRARRAVQILDAHADDIDADDGAIEILVDREDSAAFQLGKAAIQLIEMTMIPNPIDDDGVPMRVARSRDKKRHYQIRRRRAEYLALRNKPYPK